MSGRFDLLTQIARMQSGKVEIAQEDFQDATKALDRPFIKGSAPFGDKGAEHSRGKTGERVDATAAKIGL
jgi:hypothetical protein